VQVLPLLSDCLVGLYHHFEEKGISPQVDFAQEGFRVRADEECLRRIFHNLIQNALLHGSGEIAVRQEGGSLIFENTVSETSRPDLEHIFDRFYKADSARRKGSSGLGLFIVKELAERMGGSVHAFLEGDRLRITLTLDRIMSA
ncbi:MAG: sensor histidine kinase, partial [Acetatifactor sp.]|nr:sensor histidine kinase [Acetatifactor sp.]